LQEDLSTTRKFGGTGLGLAISNQLLELMNSKLLLKSKYGKGSDFHFLEVEVEERRHSSISSPRPMIKEYLDNTRILIVEDNKINMLKNW
jgi:hypothetical protein